MDKKTAGARERTGRVKGMGDGFAYSAGTI